MHVTDISIADIVVPAHLHRDTLDPDALRDLANSIRDLGLINPITVERDGQHYVLRAGHRRVEAAKLLERTTIAACVRDAGETGNGEVITLAENLDRADLTPIEEARVLTRWTRDLHLDPAVLARRAHRSLEWVEQRLQLLDLPEHMQQLVHERALPMSHALALADVTDAQHRDYLLRYAVNAGASLATVREWIRAWEMAAAAGIGEHAPRPDMIEPGQAVTVTMPCRCCHAVHDVARLLIVRICSDCAAELDRAQLESANECDLSHTRA